MTDNSGSTTTPGADTVPHRQYVWIAFAAAAVGYVVAILLLMLLQQVPGGYKLAASFNLLSGLTVVTLGLERLLEPIRTWFGPDTEAKKNELATASLDAQTTAPPPAASPEVAQKQSAVNASRRETAILMWGIATGTGFLLAAGTNVLLLHAIAAPDSTLPPTWLDLLLTGLIIGAGTKPVHDLVSRIEKSKTNAEDKAARSTATPGPAAATTL